MDRVQCPCCNCHSLVHAYCVPELGDHHGRVLAVLHDAQVHVLQVRELVLGALQALHYHRSRLNVKIFSKIFSHKLLDSYYLRNVYCSLFVTFVCNADKANYRAGLRLVHFVFPGHTFLDVVAEILEAEARGVPVLSPPHGPLPLGELVLVRAGRATTNSLT